MVAGDWKLRAPSYGSVLRYIKSLFEVQLTAAAVVVEAIGDVGVLLDFAEVIPAPMACTVPASAK